MSGNLSDSELAELEDRWRKADPKGPVILLDPLPRKVRLRLWWAHQIDGAAIWLVEHKRFRLAEMLWRLFGMWR